MSVKENLKAVLNDINALKNANPTIIAVTKYYDIEKMIEAYDAGIRNFAESRALEAIEKIGKMDDTAKSQSIYHFIGHLQTNKVKYVVGNFDYIHSIDSLKLAECVDKEAKNKGIKQKILLQVNNASEPQKFGIPVLQLENLVGEIKKFNSLELTGLMNIAPLNATEDELTGLFTQMKELKDKYNLKELSMGMSNDYKTAIKCGSTMIRLGRKLFE